MRETSPMREDLQATLDARRDLGPEYEAALVDSLVERIDATIAARVQAELQQHGGKPRKEYKHHKPNGAAIIPVALGSMGLGIPLTAIASGSAGLAGLLIAWVAIVVINVAAAAAIIRRP
ncbi:hypothetical protein [Nonomuraea sp. SBT364]|uniref:hypothetical protein n=1 Tax=Nonomuraea sp. SBT364 TaxID=1580530 RepID=UPI0012E0CA65|nr:hypothetical protein [Nonomuraea sp. SBT364]